jgi:hypothetical protein
VDYHLESEDLSINEKIKVANARPLGFPYFKFVNEYELKVYYENLIGERYILK